MTDITTANGVNPFIPRDAGGPAISATPQARPDPGGLHDVLTELTLELALNNITPDELPPAERDALQQASAASLNDVEVSVGSDLRTVLTLLQQTSQRLKESESRARAAEVRAEVGMLQDQAAQQRSAADDRRTAAVTEGVTTALSGGVQIATGGAQLGASMRAGQSSMAEQESKAAGKSGKLTPKEEEAIAENDAEIRENDEFSNNADEGGPGFRDFLEQDNALLEMHNRDIREGANGGLAKRAEHWHDKAAKHASAAEDWRSREAALRTLAPGLDGVLKGAGGLSSADNNYDAGMADAQVKTDEAEATGHRAAQQQSGELRATAEATVQAAKDALNSIQNSLDTSQMVRNI